MVQCSTVPQASESREFNALMARTRGVVVRRNRSGRSVWEVVMDPHPGETCVGVDSLEFDARELNKKDPRILQKKHLGTFLQKVDVDEQTWYELSRAWIAAAHIVPGEGGRADR